MHSAWAPVWLCFMFVVTSLGVGANWYRSPVNRLRRRLRAAAAYAIAELPEGVVGRVVGTVHPAEAPLIGPLTGRPCVYCSVSISELRLVGRSFVWSVIAVDVRSVPFLLIDPSGRAVVDPGGAQVVFDVGREIAAGAITAAHAGLLARNGFDDRATDGRRQLGERIIEIGETIAVLGDGVRELDPDGAPTDGYRGAAPTRLRLNSSPRHALVISNDPSDTLVTARASARA